MQDRSPSSECACTPPKASKAYPTVSLRPRHKFKTHHTHTHTRFFFCLSHTVPSPYRLTRTCTTSCASCASWHAREQYAAALHRTHRSSSRASAAPPSPHCAHTFACAGHPAAEFTAARAFSSRASGCAHCSPMWLARSSMAIFAPSASESSRGSTRGCSTPAFDTNPRTSSRHLWKSASRVCGGCLGAAMAHVGVVAQKFALSLRGLKAWPSVTPENVPLHTLTETLSCRLRDCATTSLPLAPSLPLFFPSSHTLPESTGNITHTHTHTHLSLLSPPHHRHQRALCPLSSSAFLRPATPTPISHLEARACFLHFPLHCPSDHSLSLEQDIFSQASHILFSHASHVLRRASPEEQHSPVCRRAGSRSMLTPSHTCKAPIQLAPSLCQLTP